MLCTYAARVMDMCPRVVSLRRLPFVRFGPFALVSCKRAFFSFCVRLLRRSACLDLYP